MDITSVTRSYLETLSTSSLTDLADEYGMDIPENLNRRFIIEELFELATEENNSKSDLQEAEDVQEIEDLQKSYNETKINIVLRNPVWCYAFWDFKKNEYTALLEDPDFIGFSIIFMFFVTKEDDTPVDTFEVPVKLEDRERFVLLQYPGFYARAALVVKRSNSKPKILVESKELLLPNGLPDLSSKTLNRDVSPVLKLSKLPDILLSQYVNHRQSFS